MTQPKKVKVELADLLLSHEYRAMRAEYPLTVTLGKSGVGGDARAYDLASAPHLLVGGPTATGKTNLLDTIICSLIYQHLPDEVQFCLIDCGGGVSRGWELLPHLYLPDQPIACDWGGVSHRLKLLIGEMDKRAARFKRESLRSRIDSIEQYREHQRYMRAHLAAEHDLPLPYLVVVIDGWESRKANKTLNHLLLHLLRQAATYGMYVCLSTTHPEDISDAHFACLPMRVAFSCVSREFCHRFLGGGYRGSRLVAEEIWMDWTQFPRHLGDVMVRLPDCGTDHCRSTDKFAETGHYESQIEIGEYM